MTNPAPKLRIGTRGSPLALAQAHEVRDRLCAAHADLEPDAIEIVVIKTSGDTFLDVALKTIGGKGLFTKEIEQALQDGRIDMAVHSMKDVPTQRQPGLALSAILPREDVRDVFLSRKYASLSALPDRATVGTASLRRQAQLRRLRPDLHIVMFRGNIQTRMKKLEVGEADATLLAAAGLRRMDALDQATEILEPETMLPAIAQGAIGIETRADDNATVAAVSALNDGPTALRVETERAFLAGVDGNCTTPIAGLAEISADGTTVDLRVELLLPDGSEAFDDRQSCPSTDGPALGAELATVIRAKAGPDFFARLAEQAAAAADG